MNESLHPYPSGDDNTTVRRVLLFVCHSLSTVTPVNEFKDHGRD